MNVYIPEKCGTLWPILGATEQEAWEKLMAKTLSNQAELIADGWRIAEFEEVR